MGPLVRRRGLGASSPVEPVSERRGRPRRHRGLPYGASFGTLSGCVTARASLLLWLAADAANMRMTCTNLPCDQAGCSGTASSHARQMLVEC